MEEVKDFRLLYKLYSTGVFSREEYEDMLQHTSLVVLLDATKHVGVETIREALNCLKDRLTKYSNEELIVIISNNAEDGDNYLLHILAGDCLTNRMISLSDDDLIIAARSKSEVVCDIAIGCLEKRENGRALLKTACYK